MTEIIDRLKLDHKRLRRVLGATLEALDDVSDGSTTAEDRLYCLLDYLGEYPHLVHHPTEELVFTALGEQPSPEFGVDLARVRSQHDFLERATSDLLQSVGTDSIDVDAIGDTLRAYVEAQLEHMKFEEANVFPLIESNLVALDQHEIACRLSELHDPLFDAHEQRFQALYECLGVAAESMQGRAAAATAQYLANRL
ncbi:MAG: hypothetical protein GKR90_16270 [Pseudomonadales bacterium]|nr:hypothetical protein [Pseudomonadales bacterium]